MDADLVSLENLGHVLYLGWCPMSTDLDSLPENQQCCQKRLPKWLAWETKDAHFASIDPGLTSAVPNFATTAGMAGNLMERLVESGYKKGKHL